MMRPSGARRRIRPAACYTLPKTAAVELEPTAFSYAGSPSAFWLATTLIPAGDVTMALGAHAGVPRSSSPIVSPDDPRLASMGREEVAGADQIAGMLAATPDERLDSLVAILRFVADARMALRERDADGPAPAA